LKAHIILYKFTISSFFISQRILKARIIANPLKIIRNKEVLLFFERKGFKYMMEMGLFGGK
jgi:hypothetical protein